MDRGIKESDWKIFRKLREDALERFCRNVLDEIAEIASRKNQSNYDRYIKIYKIVNRRDEELADAFDNPRRSVAVFQLARMRFQKLLDEADYLQFSTETREKVQGFTDMWENPNRWKKEDA